MEYVLLLNLEIRHTFYKDGLCMDFDIIPTERTQIDINNYKLLFRKLPTGFNILSRARLENGKRIPFVEIPSELSLSFNMVLENSEFPLFTAKLDNLHLNSNPEFIMGGDNMLEPVNYSDWHIEKLMIGANETKKVILHMPPVIKSRNVDFRFYDNDIKTTYFPDENSLSISNEKGTGRLISFGYNAYKELPTGVYGRITLDGRSINNVISKDNSVHQAIQFYTKNLRIKYFIISKESLAKARIIDQNNDENVKLRFERLNNSNDDKLNPAIPMYNTLIDRFKGNEVYGYISEAEIEIQEKNDVQLRLTRSDETNIIISKLPIPTPSKQGVQIIKISN